MPRPCVVLGRSVTIPVCLRGALMPLDVQPLSRTRHWLMVVVMAALLMASLGFAQTLVNRRLTRGPLAGAARVRVVFLPPPGVRRMLVNDSLDPSKPIAISRAL